MRDEASFVDPNGYLFHEGGEILRNIYPHRSAFYKGLLTSPLYSELSEDFGLVPTAINAESETGLTLTHKRLPISYCTEWCPSQLKDAALQTIDLNLRLLDEGLTLQDASPWNVLYEGGAAKFVDFTSLVENNEPYLWKPYKQFLTLFYFPLLLMSLGKGHWARLKLQDPLNGVSASDVIDFVKARDLFLHPAKFGPIWLENVLDRFLQTRQELKLKLREASQKNLEKRITPALQKNFLLGLRKKVEGINFSRIGAQFDWENYYAEQDRTVEYREKLAILEKLLARTGGKTALDIGCNTGRFSILAEKLGFTVTSVDANEGCIETLYGLSRAKNLKILPLVADISNPVSSYGFAASQFAPLLSRLQSDTVLFLGIMHHIHINCRQPFTKIAAMLNQVTREHLIFEYVDLHDANNKLLDQGREINYSLKDVAHALSPYFDIEEHPSDRATRKILLCKKKS